MLFLYMVSAGSSTSLRRVAGQPSVVAEIIFVAATLRTPFVAAVGGCSRWFRSSFLRWCRLFQVPNLPAFDVGLGLLPFELLYYYLSGHVLGLFLRKLYLSELSYHYDYLTLPFFLLKKRTYATKCNDLSLRSLVFLLICT